MKVLCLGHISYDITFPVKEFIEENKKMRVQERIECGGGPASNAAYLLGSWGIDTYIAGLIGNDEYGRRVKKEFEKININTDYLEMRNNYQTSNSIIINNTSNGSRTILSYRASKESMKDFSLNFEPDVILIDGHEVEMSNKVLDRYPNAVSIIDAGRATEEVINLAKRVTYVVTSKEFAESVTGITVDYEKEETLIKLYHRMNEIFKGEVIITLESKGCLYKYKDAIGIMDAIKVKAVDSTGAGDLFHGAFTYGICKKYDLNVALTIATVAGGLSVTKIGGRNSVATKEEMRNYIHDFE